MNKKTLTFNYIREKFPPYSITLVSGSFDPFNEYYFRYLFWASQQNRPFVVIVQKDEMVLKRRGFLPLSATHKTRAEIISSLDFVDYVVIDNKRAHDKESIIKLRPKIIVLQRDNLNYRKAIKKDIERFDSRIKIKISPFYYTNFRRFDKQKFIIKNATNKIAKKLIDLTKKSEGTVSKISAILTDDKNRILAEANNSAKEEHAEYLLLHNLVPEKANLERCIIYVLIPPCLMCAREILKHNIKKVFYLLAYGDGKGIEYLKKNSIQIKKL